MSPTPPAEPPQLALLRERLGGRLAFGGDYNPEQWPEAVWPEDIRLMREAGVNLVTVGVFSWARLEPSPGRFDFGWLDRVLALLADAGIAVDLATATASPPPWLARRHPDSLPVTADGVRLWPGSRQHYCPSSPAYREAAVRMATRMATRYGHHPALALWHVNNEYAAHTDACYCDRCAEGFRRWLRLRYGGVQGVNEAWGTDFWSQRYGALEEVNPPRRAPYSANPGQQLDYRRFMSDAVLECFVLERDVLRRITPQVPVTTNFMGLFKPLDYWSWAREEDVVSHDAYPDLEEVRPELGNALASDLMRSLRHGRPWLLMETAPSAINWRPRNPPKGPGLMRLWAYQSVARGADAILYFQWRASRRGAEKFHSAVVPHGGPDTRVFREVSRLGAELARLTTVPGTRVPAEVALLLAWDSWWALELDSKPSTDLRLLDRITACYTPLWEANLPVDFRRPEDDLSAYRLVVVPNLYLVSDAAAANLVGYVEAGGHLVMSFFSGIVDPGDGVRLGGYPAPFRDLLGLRIAEFWPLREGETLDVVLADGPAGGTASLWAEDISVQGADVLARFASGELAGAPAVTRHRYGSGVATYVGTAPEPGLLRALLLDAAAAVGVRPPVADVPAGVEVVRRGDALFVLNHSGSEARVRLPGRHRSLIDEREVLDELVLAPRGVAVLVEAPALAPGKTISRSA